MGKLAVCGLRIVIIDSSFAKLRFFRIAEYLGAAFCSRWSASPPLTCSGAAVRDIESLSAASPEGVLLDFAAVLILLCSFACLGSKLFGRYVTYYGAQSILSFATAWSPTSTAARLWTLALLTLAIKGIGIPVNGPGAF